MFYCSTLIANAFRDGVMRRETPNVRYACRWNSFFTRNFSTQLVLQINFTQTKTDCYLLIHGHAAICTKLHCLFKADSTRKKHDFLQVPWYIIGLGLLSQERMLEPDHWSGMHEIIPFSFPNCSAPGYIQARPDHSATSTSYGYDQTPAPTGVLCCRIIAITVSICKRHGVQYMISLRPKEARR